MRKFRSAYDEDQYTRYIAPTGSRIHEEKGWIIEDGEYQHVTKKTYNLYEKIQAARDSCDLKAILARYEAGDESALDRIQGSYFDLVSLPKNYTELYNVVSTCNETFEKMPIELKNKYRNSPAYFWSKVGTKQFDADFQEVRDKVFMRKGMADPNPMLSADQIKSIVKDAIVETPIKKDEVDK